MKKFITIFKVQFIITCLTICFSLLGYLTFLTGKRDLSSKIEWVLKETIDRDYSKRIFSISQSSSGSLERKVKGYKITTENGPEMITFKDSIDEQTGRQLTYQYTLSVINPIISNDFNTIFKEELSKRGITDKAGIIYRHNGKPQYNDNDSISPQTALRTRIKMLDIKNTVSVQAWVDYSWATLFHNMDSKSIWSVIGGYILSLVVILYKSKKKQPILEETEENENCHRVAGIILDLDRKTLSINNIKCTINNLEFDLLLLFLQTSDYYLTREEIAQAFWPKEDMPNDKINSHISVLRRILRDFPEYKLETDKGKGYYLTIPQEG